MLVLSQNLMSLVSSYLSTLIDILVSIHATIHIQQCTNNLLLYTLFFINQRILKDISFSLLFCVSFNYSYICKYEHLKK